MSRELREIRISFWGRCAQAFQLAFIVGIPNPEGEAVGKVFAAVGQRILPKDRAGGVRLLVVKRFMLRREAEGPIKKVPEFMEGGGRDRDVNPSLAIRGESNAGQAVLTAVRLQVCGRDVVLPPGLAEGAENGGRDTFDFHEVSVEVCGRGRLDGQRV